MSSYPLDKYRTQSIYRQQKKHIGKYLSFGTINKSKKKSQQLTPYMVTLSPAANNIPTLQMARKQFFERIKAIRKHHKYEFMYFSAIEIGVNFKNHYDLKFMEDNISRDGVNLHVHIQIWTDMPEEKIELALSKVDSSLCYFSYLTPPKIKGKEYSYVIKDLTTIDWDMRRYIAQNYKSVTLYTHSQTEVADYIIKPIWNFFQKHHQYKTPFDNINNKFKFLLDSQAKKEIIISDVAINRYGKNYDKLTITNKSKTKTKIVYIKKNIL